MCAGTQNRHDLRADDLCMMSIQVHFALNATLLAQIPEDVLCVAQQDLRDVNQAASAHIIMWFNNEGSRSTWAGKQQVSRAFKIVSKASVFSLIYILEKWRKETYKSLQNKSPHVRFCKTVKLHVKTSHRKPQRDPKWPQGEETLNNNKEFWRYRRNTKRLENK